MMPHTDDPAGPATLCRQQRVRYARLLTLVASEWRVSQHCPADQALIATEQGEPQMLARYAATSYTGSDCWISLHDTCDDAAKHLATEAESEVPMAPMDILDLDTGQGWSVSLQPLVTEWPADTVAQFAKFAPGGRQL